MDSTKTSHSSKKGKNPLMSYVRKYISVFYRLEYDTQGIH